MTNPIPNLGLIQFITGTAVLAALLTWESCSPFFPFFHKNAKRRGVHLVRNLSVSLLNAALMAAGFTFLWGRVAEGSAATGFGLLHRAGLPVWLHAVAAVLLLDLWTYGWHRANHRLPLLWRFHRMHHSDPWMDVTTARRFHPGEILFSSVLRLPLILFLGVHLWELALYQMLMGVVVDFHHANIALPERADRLLRTLVVTPAMHKVHHSQVRAETDSNYTSLLSLWDRVFGSFRLRPDLSAVRLGLSGWSDAPRQTLSGMLTTPLQSASKP